MNELKAIVLLVALFTTYKEIEVIKFQLLKMEVKQVKGNILYNINHIIVCLSWALFYYLNL